MQYKKDISYFKFTISTCFESFWVII